MFNDDVSMERTSESAHGGPRLISAVDEGAGKSTGEGGATGSVFQFPQIPDRRAIEDLSLSASRAAAERLLMSPTFFTKCLDALRRMGLVGEQKNALVLYLLGTSRLLPKPMNTFVKGHSATGKSFLARTALDLIPKASVVELTSASDTAWDYSADSFVHKIVYVQEQRKASGSVHQVRLLISEGKLIRRTTVREKGTGRLIVERFEAKGPIAAVSTTTQDRLEIDDETRHVSLWMDDSPEQTKRILKSYVRQPERPAASELAIWHEAQELLAERAGIEISLPEWFDYVAEGMADAAHDVRLRRYFPMFCEACRAVALLRSFRPTANIDNLEAEFADYAIAHILMDSVISESLHHEGDQNLDIAESIRRLMARTGEAVLIQQLAEELSLPYKRAAERVQEAESAGLIQRANSSEMRNVKRFVATSPQQLLPAPSDLFRKLRLGHTCSFHHPLTGELVVYAPETAASEKVMVPVPRTDMTSPTEVDTTEEIREMTGRLANLSNCQLAETDQAVPLARPEREGANKPQT